MINGKYTTSSLKELEQSITVGSGVAVTVIYFDIVIGVPLVGVATHSMQNS